MDAVRVLRGAGVEGLGATVRPPVAGEGAVRTRPGRDAAPRPVRTAEALRPCPVSEGWRPRGGRVHGRQPGPGPAGPFRPVVVRAPAFREVIAVASTFRSAVTNAPVSREVVTKASAFRPVVADASGRFGGHHAPCSVGGGCRGPENVARVRTKPTIRGTPAPTHVPPNR